MMLEAAPAQKAIASCSPRGVAEPHRPKLEPHL